MGDVDDLIASLDGEELDAIQQLRDVVTRIHGKPLLGFTVGRNHLSLHVFNPAALAGLPVLHHVPSRMLDRGLPHVGFTGLGHLMARVTASEQIRLADDRRSVATADSEPVADLGWVACRTT